MNTNNCAESKQSQNVAPNIETSTDVSDRMPFAGYPDIPGFAPANAVRVGGVLLADTPIEYNIHRKTVKLKVRNTGDRPIQIGSHYHFFEVNRYMEFDRPASFGYHLNIPATTAIRFEPGEEKEVELVMFGGKNRIIGFGGLTMGYAGMEEFPTYYPTRIKAINKMDKYGFKSVSEAEAEAEYTTKEPKKE